MFDMVATEAMAAQLQSKLGKSLDALWQDVIDFRDKNCLDMSRVNRFKTVRDYFHRNTVKKFCDIVWKEVGLWISEVSYIELWECGFATLICIDKDLDNHSNYGRGTLDIVNDLNGGYYERVYGGTIPEHLSANELIMLAESYDPVKGGILDSMKDKVRKLVRPKMLFDIRTGFCLEDFLPPNSGVKNFTAQELTAILLHEIGHTLTLVEHAADKFARISTFKYLTDTFIKQNGTNAEEAVALGKAAANVLVKNGQPENAKKVTTMVTQFEKDMKKAGPNCNPTAKSKLVFGLIGSLITIVFDVFFIAGNVLFGANTRRFNPAEMKKKYGDIPCNYRLIEWQERKADEYAFSNGYGVHQVTALEKLHKLFARLGYSEKDIAKINLAEKLHKDISVFKKLRILILAPMITHDAHMYTYPYASRRFKEMMNLMIQQLKSHNADPEYVAKYMADIEETLRAIEDYNKCDEFVIKVCKGYDLLISYFSIPGFYDMLMHGRIKRELENLVDDINKLNNNLLFFYGEKFSQLANKG